MSEKQGVVRYNPKPNYIGDQPMYHSASGRWVDFRDWKTLADKLARQEAELTRIYIELQVAYARLKQLDQGSGSALSLDNGTGKVPPRA